jgi:hypothetical protein
MENFLTKNRKCFSGENRNYYSGVDNSHRLRHGASFQHLPGGVFPAAGTRPGRVFPGEGKRGVGAVGWEDKMRLKIIQNL